MHRAHHAHRVLHARGRRRGGPAPPPAPVLVDHVVEQQAGAAAGLEGQADVDMPAQQVAGDIAGAQFDHLQPYLGQRRMVSRTSGTVRILAIDCGRPMATRPSGR